MKIRYQALASKPFVVEQKVIALLDSALNSVQENHNFKNFYHGLTIFEYRYMTDVRFA